MAKRTITTIWIVGSVIMFAGGFASLLVSYATDPGNFLNGKSGTSVALLALCLSMAACGVIVQLVAWIGALVNTHRLVDKTWFNILLWVGIIGIVTSPIVIGGLVWWGLMLAYVIAGLDGMAAQPPQRETPAVPRKIPMPTH